MGNYLLVRFVGAHCALIVLLDQYKCFWSDHSLLWMGGGGVYGCLDNMPPERPLVGFIIFDAR